MNLEKYGISNPFEALGIFGMGAVLGGVVMRAYMNSILHDRGHTQLVVPQSHAEALLEIFESNGVKPRRKIVQGPQDAPSVVQALLEKSETVLLAAKEESLEAMGQPTCGKTFISKTPLEAAQAAVEVFEEHGIEAHVDTTVHDESGDPLYHVMAEGCSIALGWRPHGKNMPGPFPAKWTQADSLVL